MKRFLIIISMCMASVGFYSCKEEVKTTEEEFEWIVDKFDDIKILRYQVTGFEKLSLEQKMLVYYLNEAALQGRDILFDQNFKYNLAVRRTLEVIYENADSEIDRNGAEWASFEKYLKKVWFANGVHHHYSNEKFTPEFSVEYFEKLLEHTPESYLPQDFDNTDSIGSVNTMLNTVFQVLFDPEFYPLRVNQNPNEDMLATSAMNYYEDITQREAEAFYSRMAARYPDKNRPVSFGLNSKLVRENGQLTEKTWRVGGMYSPAIENIVVWLEKAAGVASEKQRPTIEALISFYRSGDLKEFDRFNILWVQDTVSSVDFVNGFTETYGDPLGYKASWEAMVNVRDEEATKRTEAISRDAQWFEDHSPVDNKYKKKTVKGVSAKVINAAILGGDCYPATPIGINLPNADWIRRDYGSKSVTIQNITRAYAESSKGNGFREEFVLREEDRTRMDVYGTLADNLHTDLHECLGHGSGQLAPGVKGDELKNYGAALEEARADLFALYYLADRRLIDMGIVPSPDVYKAEYASYVMNGMMTQLTRIQPGKNVEQAHMRNRMLVSNWAYEHGKADNVIEKTEQDGKTYIVVNDFEKLRALFGQLLKEVQRVKSEGDYAAGKKLVETYGVKVDQALHEEVLTRYAALELEPYSGFMNPQYKPVIEKGNIVDINIDYPTDYPAQMLHYSKHYSALPTTN